MKYRILKNENNEYKVQSKTLFFWRNRYWYYYKDKITPSCGPNQFCSPYLYHISVESAQEHINAIIELKNKLRKKRKWKVIILAEEDDIATT